MSTIETALTAHLVMPGNGGEPFLASACKELHDRFDIDQTALQIDPKTAPAPLRARARRSGLTFAFMSAKDDLPVFQYIRTR